MKKYILALDEGTTSARSILFDREGKIVSISQKEIEQFYPENGWFEQDAAQIWKAQRETMEDCVRKAAVDPEEIAAIGITNQRETTVVWEKETGKPIANAIVWQCRRTAGFCEELKRAGKAEMIREKTGLPIDAYFSGTKLKWILDHVPGARGRAERGEILFGTVDSYLLYMLTGGTVHVTDATNASRTMLCDIRYCEWDDELLGLFGVPRAMLPQIRSSSEIYGTAELLGARIPIAGIAGDQQAALFGQGCFASGGVKNTYGTGCFLLMHTGTEPCFGRTGLITTVAAGEKGQKTEYALEGSVFIGGAVIKWLRDEMGMISSAEESETLASKVRDTGGVYLIPAFAGLGAPYWDMYARGTVVGMTRSTNRFHIVRAALESIALQTNDVIDALRRDTGLPVTRMLADGGASHNALLMQMQADVSDLTVAIGRNPEATALGAAFLAGLAVGFWKDRDELSSLLQVKREFVPETDAAEREKKLAGWKKAVGKAKEWEEE